MDPRKKALEVLHGLADEALRARRKKAPPPEVKAEPKEEEFSAEDEEQLAKLYESETAGIGRA